MISQKRSWTVWLAALPLTWALAGCGGGDKPKAGGGGTKPAGTSTSSGAGGEAKGGDDKSTGAENKGDVKAAATPAGWGTIKGTVAYDGQPPTPEMIHKAGSDVKDAATCSAQDLPSEALVVKNDNGGVRWVLVYLDSPKENPIAIHPDWQKAEGDVEFGQEHCAFKPHLLACRQGQKLIVSSSDPIGHNTNLKPWRGEGMNTIVPAAEPGKKSMIDGPDLRAQPRPFPVNCDIHRWMTAHIMVFDHPYFAVTDENGHFEIKNVPAGKVKLISWQETCLFGEGGREGKDVEVTPDGVTELSLKMKAPAK